MCLAVYTALVSGLTCLAIWCLLRQHRKALLGSIGFQPPLRPGPVHILPKRKVFHHRHCHHLAQRDAQLAQSNLHGATCRDQLAGATCAEQLAQSNLHSATCAEQLAQTNLHRPVCAEHLAWRCLAPTCTHCNSHRATCAKQLAQSNLRMCQAGVKQVCRTSWGVMLSGHSPCRSLTRSHHERSCEEHDAHGLFTGMAHSWLLCGILRMRFGSNRSHEARSS